MSCLTVVLHMMTIMASPYLFRKGMKIKFSKYRLHLKEFCHSSFYYFFSMCSQNFCWMLVELFVPELGEATLGWIMHAWKLQICWLIFGKYLHMHTHSRQSFSTPQWDTADTEIQVPSFENPQLTDLLPLKPGEGHSLYRAMQLLLLPGVSVCVHMHVRACVRLCVCACAHVCT